MSKKKSQALLPTDPVDVTIGETSIVDVPAMDEVYFASEIDSSPAPAEVKNKGKSKVRSQNSKGKKKGNKEKSKAEKGVQKSEIKRAKEELKARKQAALRQFKAEEKQLKSGAIPIEEEEQEARIGVDFYGEKLPYPGGFPVYCSKYVIISDDSPRAALRFFNASDVVVTGLRFSLVEKDENGEVIDTLRIERNGLFSESSTEFSVCDAHVSANCVQIEVKIESVRSDEYEYIIGDEGEVTLKYGVDGERKDFYFKHKPSFSVKKRRRNYVFLSLLAVILATLVSVLMVWGLGVLDKAEETKQNFERQTTITQQIYGGDLYVEA